MQLKAQRSKVFKHASEVAAYADADADVVCRENYRDDVRRARLAAKRKREEEGHAD